MMSARGKLNRQGEIVDNQPHAMISGPYKKNAEIGICDVPAARRQGIPYINHKGTVDAIIVVDVMPAPHQTH
jgi:hypothetical protein